MCRPVLINSLFFKLLVTVGQFQWTVTSVCGVYLQKENISSFIFNVVYLNLIRLSNKTIFTTCSTVDMIIKSVPKW